MALRPTRAASYLDPDAATRKANLDYVTERLALADAVAARCCVDIAGSYNPKIWYGMDPKNLSKQFLDATVENCRHVIDAVRPTRTHFTIEMMPWSLPDGPDSYLALIKAVDRPSFAVHLDVCNVINSPERFYNNKAVIEDCFRKLGKWITSCHAKDLAWIPEYNVHFAEVIPLARMTAVLAVPAGNPKHIESWGELFRADVGFVYRRYLPEASGFGHGFRRRMPRSRFGHSTGYGHDQSLGFGDGDDHRSRRPL